MSYGYQEADSRLAFERMTKALEGAGVGGKQVVFARFYPLAEPLAAQVRRLRPGFFATTANSMVVAEGLSSMDAGFGIDVVAVKD